MSAKLYGLHQTINENARDVLISLEMIHTIISIHADHNMSSVTLMNHNPAEIHAPHLKNLLDHVIDATVNNDDVTEPLLAHVLDKYSVHLGGSSIGRNFRRAARYFLRAKAPQLAGKVTKEVAHYDTSSLLPNVTPRVEDPFYVCDLGVVVSQFYQWKKLLGRVEPFYAVKCNPDPAILSTLVLLGSKFDCASRGEIRMVQDVYRSLKKIHKDLVEPEIIFANPCKQRSHVIEAVCKGVCMTTFDNISEIKKCAGISKNIQLILRIITDDSGSQCRLSSKFGAPRSKWRELLAAAKVHGLQVVGASFHVGSGCRDASRYDMALKDARDLFDIAEKEYGMKMTLLDIGGGFPGETHSLWNPMDRDEDEESVHLNKIVEDHELSDEEDEDIVKKMGKTIEEQENSNKEDNEKYSYMFFADIAKYVAPRLDDLFPASTGVRIIAEPGRYLVAAACTLVASVISVRENSISQAGEPEPISDALASMNLDKITRDEEKELVRTQGNTEHDVIGTIVDELASYSQLYTAQYLAQQEIDVLNEKSTAGLLEKPKWIKPDGPKEAEFHTVEGLSSGIVNECLDEEQRPRSKSRAESMDKTMTTESGDNGNNTASGTLMLAAAGEAAISGVVFQAVADSGPLLDDFAYYLNDGVYGGFNNLMFDHASVRPRFLKNTISKSHRVIVTETDDAALESDEESVVNDNDLFASTIFGPTCDSIDVISRSVLLPKLDVGDWLYFQNMGAYTSAAASGFNGFTPTEKFYVCSVQPEHYEKLFQNRR